MAESTNSRPLGMLERVLLDREKINHWGTITSVLLLTSEEELIHDHLRKALSLLPKRFPLLRMRINESGSQPYFEEMENPETVDFRVLDEITADEWEKGFEKETDGPLFIKHRFGATSALSLSPERKVIRSATFDSVLPCQSAHLLSKKTVLPSLTLGSCVKLEGCPK